MVRLTRLLPIFILIVLLFSACQPIQAQPPVSTEKIAISIADITGVWRAAHPQTGEFRIVIDADGAYRAISTDGSVVHDMGKVVLVGRELQYVSADKGHEHCTLPEEVTGRYEATVTKVNGKSMQITYKLIADSCIIRRQSTLYQPLERVEE